MVHENRSTKLQIQWVQTAFYPDQMKRRAMPVVQGCKGKRTEEAGRDVYAQNPVLWSVLRMTLSQQGLYTLSTNADCRASEDRRFFWSFLPCRSSAGSCSSGLCGANVPGLRISKPELTLRRTWF
jgi:hypothetical protein